MLPATLIPRLPLAFTNPIPDRARAPGRSSCSGQGSADIHGDTQFLGRVPQEGLDLGIPLQTLGHFAHGGFDGSRGSHVAAAIETPSRWRSKSCQRATKRSARKPGLARISASACMARIAARVCPLAASPTRPGLAAKALSKSRVASAATVVLNSKANHLDTGPADKQPLACGRRGHVLSPDYGLRRGFSPAFPHPFAHNGFRTLAEHCQGRPDRRQSTWLPWHGGRAVRQSGPL